MSERSVPFHCPYCGDEDLRPHETDEGSPHGAWECRACLRAFSLRMLGLIRPFAQDGAQDGAQDDTRLGARHGARSDAEEEDS